MVDSNIVRPVEIVTGASNIGEFLGISHNEVRTFHKLGAPIRRKGKRGDFVCEKAELWLWYSNTYLGAR